MAGLVIAGQVVVTSLAAGICGFTVYKLARDNEQHIDQHIESFRNNSTRDALEARKYPNGSVCHQEYTLKAVEWTRQAQQCVDWKDRTIIGKAFGSVIHEYNALNTVERMAAAVVQSQPILSRAEGAQ